GHRVDAGQAERVVEHRRGMRDAETPSPVRRLVGITSDERQHLHARGAHRTKVRQHTEARTHYHRTQRLASHAGHPARSVRCSPAELARSRRAYQEPPPPPPPPPPEKPPPLNPLEPLDAGADVSVPALVTANPSMALEKIA